MRWWRVRFCTRRVRVRGAASAWRPAPARERGGACSWWKEEEREGGGCGRERRRRSGRSGGAGKNCTHKQKPSAAMVSKRAVLETVDRSLARLRISLASSGWVGGSFAARPRAAAAGVARHWHGRCVAASHASSPLPFHSLFLFTLAGALSALLLTRSLTFGTSRKVNNKSCVRGFQSNPRPNEQSRRKHLFFFFSPLPLVLCSWQPQRRDEQVKAKDERKPLDGGSRWNERLESGALEVVFSDWAMSVSAHQREGVAAGGHPAQSGESTRREER